jgi:hypothetical protein
MKTLLILFRQLEFLVRLEFLERFRSITNTYYITLFRQFLERFRSIIITYYIILFRYSENKNLLLL